MTRQLPNPPLRDRDIVAYLTSRGIDVPHFDQFVRADIPATKFRLFFKKPNGSTWTRQTFSYWVKVYREQVLKETDD